MTIDLDTYEPDTQPPYQVIVVQKKEPEAEIDGKEQA